MKIQLIILAILAVCTIDLLADEPKLINPKPVFKVSRSNYKRSVIG